MLSLLRRHRLAYIAESGWQSVLAGRWDDDARACLTHWASRRLPLVVTRQPFHPSGSSKLPVSLGLSAPETWGRRRFALQVPHASLLYFDEFPELSGNERCINRKARPDLRQLVAGVQASGSTLRLFGSFGWQLLTGMKHAHEGSDLDLWALADSPEQADVLAGLLLQFGSDHYRLDGELVFLDGSAVAWREWSAWRAGRTRQLLVKTVHGAYLREAKVGAGMQFIAHRVAA